MLIIMILFSLVLGVIIFFAARNFVGNNIVNYHSIDEQSSFVFEVLNCAKIIHLASLFGICFFGYIRSRGPKEISTQTEYSIGFVYSGIYLVLVSLLYFLVI